MAKRTRQDMEERIVTLAKCLKTKIIGPDTQDHVGIYIERSPCIKKYRLVYHSDNDKHNGLFGEDFSTVSQMCGKLDDLLNVIIMFDLERPKRSDNLDEISGIRLDKDLNKSAGINSDEEGDSFELESDSITCPCCGDETLAIDYEYMAGTYGAAYSRMPVKDFVYACENPNCEECGTLEELRETAKQKKTQ